MALVGVFGKVEPEGEGAPHAGLGLVGRVVGQASPACVILGVAGHPAFVLVQSYQACRSKKIRKKCFVFSGWMCAQLRDIEMN